MSGADALVIWTVYDHPTDFPDEYVARKFIGAEATVEVMVCAALEPIRIELANRGFVCLQRADGDDAKIIETWL